MQNATSTTQMFRSKGMWIDLCMSDSPQCSLTSAASKRIDCVFVDRPLPLTARA